VLTALALAGWGVRAAGTPNKNTSNTSSVPLAAPTQAAQPNAAPSGDANNGNTNNGAGGGGAADQNGGAAAVNLDKTAKLIATTIPKMGAVVTDEQGFVLYRFDKDTAKPPATNCDAKCLKTWPAVVSSNGNIPELEGMDPSIVGTVQRPDGSMQVTIGGWPAYRYIGDVKAGTWKGQGVGGIWWVMDQHGRKNLTCVPTSTPTAVAPPADNGGNGGGNTGGGDYGSGGTY
jgi:predicted lipoprotein with Yx(FWY)xxD motif